MPRTYKSTTKNPYKKYDEDTIKKALQELQAPNAALCAVAKKYDINKSVLHRHKTKLMKRPGGQPALSENIECILIENLKKCAEWSYPLDTLDLRYLIKMYLDKAGIHNKKFKNNFPGPDFVHGFLQRNKDKISHRIIENIKRGRAELSPDTIKKYFTELEKSLEGVPPSNVVNYDQTILTDDPGRTKALVRRGCKYPERKINSTKASVCLMMSGSAEGELLPPYIVYKAKHLYNTWVKNSPEEAWYNRSSSRCFDGEIFEDWLEKVVIPYFKDKPGRKVLVGDNLASHISINLIEICKEQNIDFVFLPANSTHLMQPLDVALFRPMKIAWRKLVLAWKKTDGRNLQTIPKGDFPKLLKRLMEEIKVNSKNNLISGFQKTGICPLDPNEVLTRLTLESPVESDTQKSIEDAVLSILKEMRYETNITEGKRKLNVVETDETEKPVNKTKKTASIAPSAAAEPFETRSNNAKASTSNSNESEMFSGKEFAKTEILNYGETSKKINKGKGVGKNTKTLPKVTEEIKKGRIWSKKKVETMRIDDSYEVHDNMNERETEEVNEKRPSENNDQGMELDFAIKNMEVEMNMEELNVESMPLFFFDDIACEETVEFNDLNYTDENVHQPMNDTDDGNKNNNIKVTSEKVIESTLQVYSKGEKKILMKDFKIVPLNNLQIPKKSYSNQTHVKPTTTIQIKTNFCINKEKIVKALLEDDSE